MDLTLEEQYLELLNKIVYPPNRLDLSIEHRIIEANKLVTAKHKFERAMDRTTKQITIATERDRF